MKDPKMRQEAKALRQKLQKEIQESRDSLNLPKRSSKLNRVIKSIAIILLIWLLWPQCSVEPPSPMKPIAPVIVPQPSQRPITTKELPPKPPKARRVPPKPRPSMQIEAPSQPGWLHEFQAQVSARAPDLAKCAEGSPGPGALRWTGILAPKSGQITEQSFEPIGTNSVLTPTQEECLKRVFKSKAFRVVYQGDSSPRRVTLLLEY